MRQLLAVLKSSLAFRVALGLALVGLLPVGLLAYRLIDINRSAMEQQVRLTHVRVARSSAAEISARVAALNSLAAGLARNPAISDARSTTARALLADSLEAWSDLGVASIAIVNPAGERVIQAQLNDNRVRVWSDEMLSADPAIGVHAATIDADFVLRVSAALSEARGFVWLVADGAPVREALDNYELGRDAQVALATRSGTPILGTVDEYATEMLDHATSQWVDGFNTTPATDVDGFIGAHAAVVGTDWAVLSQQPLSVAHEVAFRMRDNARLAIGLASILALGLFGLAYASVVRPIRQLAAAQRRLAGVSGGSASGAIDDLRLSFEALEQRMKEQRDLDEVFLGRFQVRKVLGSGAMGTVFRGYDPKLERPVALKTLRFDRKLSKERRQDLLSRLVKEAVVTARFNHPNIVAIYDVQEGEDSAFMAMEFIDGPSLEPYVWSVEALSGEQTVALGAQVARGLAAAHENGLVHRDIKPANILLGTNGSIKITDFGIAELLSSMAASDDVVFGTPGYLPPEALQGKGHDKASDLFALGAVLYFCVTGRRPFEGKTIKEVIRKTLFGSARPPSEVVPNVPKELEALILSLLSSDPGKRPPDATAVAKRLEALAISLSAEWQAPVVDKMPPVPSARGTSDGGAFLPTMKVS